MHALLAKAQADLKKLAHSKLSSVRLAHRACSGLQDAQGLQNTAIAEQLGIAWMQVPCCEQQPATGRHMTTQ